MHTCPVCGMECDCSGDIDDASVMSEEWVLENCECDHDHLEAYEPDDGSGDLCVHCHRPIDHGEMEYRCSRCMEAD